MITLIITLLVILVVWIGLLTIHYFSNIAKIINVSDKFDELRSKWKWHEHFIRTNSDVNDINAEKLNEYYQFIKGLEKRLNVKYDHNKSEYVNVDSNSVEILVDIDINKYIGKEKRATIYGLLKPKNKPTYSEKDIKYLKKELKKAYKDIEKSADAASEFYLFMESHKDNMASFIMDKWKEIHKRL